LSDGSTLELLVGQLGGKDRLVVNESQPASDRRTWNLQRESPAGFGELKQTDLGEFTAVNGELQFAWRRGVERKQADMVRNCVLRVLDPAEGIAYDVRLRKPVEVEPISLKLSVGNLGGAIPAGWRSPEPPPGTAYVLALRLEDKMAAFRPKISPEDAMALEHGRTLRFEVSKDAYVEMSVKYDISKHRIGCEARIDWKEEGDSRSLRPSPGLDDDLKQAVNRTQARHKKLDELLGKRRVAKDKKKGLTDKDRESIKEDIAEQERQLKTVSEELDDLRKLRKLTELLESNRLHFRIFMKVEDVEVDLVRTTDAPAETDAAQDHQ
jgi:hypothetical protein